MSITFRLFKKSNKPTDIQKIILHMKSLNKKTSDSNIAGVIYIRLTRYTIAENLHVNEMQLTRF